MGLYICSINVHIVVVTVVVSKLPPLISLCLRSEWNLRGEGGGDSRRSHPASAGRGRSHPARGGCDAHCV